LGDFERQVALQAIDDLGSGNLGALGSLRLGGLRAVGGDERPGRAVP
jgi:hypothetical protein